MTSAVDAAPQWPSTSGAGALVLAFASTPTERALIDTWVAETSPADIATKVVFADALVDCADLDAQGDVQLIPARVSWQRLPSSSTSPGLALGSLVSSRVRLNGLQQAIKRRPESFQVVVGAAATQTELRERYELTRRTELFADFVRRQGELALDRAERSHGSRSYKLPKFVLDEVRSSGRFSEGVHRLAAATGRGPEDINRQATADLQEMVADHSRLAIDAFERFGRFLTRAYSVSYDAEQLESLRTLNRQYSLVFLPSHRSYLDVFILRSTLLTNGFPANSCFGGNNMAFWPMGDWMRKTGNIVLRRSIGDDPVYKFVLRTYLQFLVSKRLNLEWYIEGGRTRTGKLRPPRFGLLTYLVDAVEDLDDESSVYLVPMSIVYDGLPEVSSLAAEQTGQQKKNERISWLLNYPRSTGAGFGKVHLSFGEPLDLRRGLLARPQETRRGRVQKIAFEVSHRINLVTPITATALVTLALLGEDDRALTFNEIREVTRPFLAYFERRKLPITVDLAQTGEVRAVLNWLTDTGVLTCYSGGAETVWAIAPDRHLDAAFYRNSIVHQLLDRAIVELVLTAAAQGRIGDETQAFDEALRLRDLLKFEFFFPDKAEFRRNLQAEMAILDPDWVAHLSEPGSWREILAEASPHLAHRTLHSFIEAYFVTADLLADSPPWQAVDEKALVDRAFGVARQRRMQQDLRSSGAISTEVIRNALSVAAHRDLLGPGGAELAGRRRAFVDELAELLSRIERMRDFARPRSEDTPPR